jgi:photosystem II stability/assembly factor-like uncharacterized protein
MKSTITFILLLGAFGLFAQTFNWTEQTSGVTTSLRDVFFADNQNGWVVGENGLILHTADGGDTWETQQSGIAEVLRAVYFIDASTGWAVGGLLSSPVLKTTNGGDTWTELSSDVLPIQIRDIFFVDANTGWAITSDSIYRSTDGGANWVHEEYADGLNGTFGNTGIYATSDTVAFVCGRKEASSGTTNATVFDKRTWNNQDIWGSAGATQFHLDEVLKDIEFASELVGFTGGQEGRLYRMESDGINLNGPWNLVYDLGFNGTIRSISFPTAHSGMFNTSVQPAQTTISLVFHTSDGGDTWSSTPDSIPDLLSAVLHAPDSLNAWMVGVQGKIFKGTRLPVSTKDVENIVEFDVFPNPFGFDLNVIISLDQPDNLIVKLSNINGQKVYENSFNLGQGNNSIELKNLNKLGSGIYFLNLYSEKGDFLASKKVVKF